MDTAHLNTTPLVAVRYRVHETDELPVTGFAQVEAVEGDHVIVSGAFGMTGNRRLPMVQVAFTSPAARARFPSLPDITTWRPVPLALFKR